MTDIVNNVMELLQDRSWRSKIGTGRGTFRGAPFFILDDATLTGGRRVVRHEYPLRDDGATEDMGLTMREYAFTGIVWGNDYLNQRDALIAALEQPEGGELAHPYWGKQFVQIATYTVRESCQGAGVALFSVTFTPAVDNTAPIVADNIQLNSSSVTDNVLSDIQAGWDTATGMITDINDIIASVEQTLNTITNGVRGLVNGAGGTLLLGNVLALQGAVKNLIRSPRQLFGGIQDILGGITASGHTSLASRTAHKLIDGVRNQPVSNKPSVAQFQQRVNTVVIVLAQAELAGIALAAAKETAKTSRHPPRLTPERPADTQISPDKIAQQEIPLLDTLEDTRQATRRIDESLLDLIILTGDLGWYRTSSSLRNYRVEFVQHMMTVSDHLPTARTVTLACTEPAVVALYRETGTVSQLQRFIRRNGIRYPAFVPGGMELEVIHE